MAGNGTRSSAHFYIAQVHTNWTVVFSTVYRLDLMVSFHTGLTEATQEAGAKEW